MRRLALAVAAGLLCAAAVPWHWNVPNGRPAPRVPADNPMSAAKVALGRRLFHDADLSIDGSMACATCHEQRRGFADGNRTHPGVHGDPGRRNVPGLANVGWARSLTWGDPRVRTLEAQVAIPVLGAAPVEMGMQGREAAIAVRLGRDSCYVRMFRDAFPETGGRIDMASVSRALAAFERTLISTDTSFDRWRAGDAGALSSPQRRGAALFARKCAACHAGPDLTDGRFHAVGTGTAADPGLGEITGRPGDAGRFRTPGLRNVALTAPYLHDGSAPTLEDAIRRHRAIAPDAEASVLIAFLGALTDERFVTDPRFGYPEVACGKRL